MINLIFQESCIIFIILATFGNVCVFSKKLVAALGRMFGGPIKGHILTSFL